MSFALSARSAVASTSRASASAPWSLRALSASLPSLSSAFSTSPATLEKRHRRAARMRKRRNEDAQELKSRLLEATRPDPIRGHQLNEAGLAAWAKCELAQVVLQKDAVWGVKEDRRGNLIPVESTHADEAERIAEAQEFGGPVRLNFGLGVQDRELLFRDLPAVQLADTVMHDYLRRPDLDAAAADASAIEAREAASAETLKRILDLRNASGRGIQAENIRRIIGHFGKRVGAPPDTGSPEVQAAVLTYRIHNLADHLAANHRHDHSNRRALALLVYQRARMLKYLKRESVSRYESILARIGVEARAVEGELMLGGMPKQRRT